MGSTLLGSAPTAQFRDLPTISGFQEGILPGALQAIWNQLQQSTSGVPAQVGYQTAAALPGQLGYQAPTAAPVAPIDATQAFQQGVVQPITSDFLSQTLPSIAGQFGGSAGGAFGSGSAQARQQAGTSAERTLGQIGSQYSLGAAAQNQNVALQQSLANLTAANQAAQIRNQAEAYAPGVAGILPSLQQTPITDLLTAALSPTTQPSGLTTGGSTGLVQALLAGQGGAQLFKQAPGAISALAALFA